MSPSGLEWADLPVRQVDFYNKLYIPSPAAFLEDEKLLLNHLLLEKGIRTVKVQMQNRFQT